MKILLSKRKKGQARHLCLIMTTQEEFEVRAIIYSDILGNSSPGQGRRPVTERYVVGGEKMVRYRFHMRYLEDLMLTFPFAEFSPGLDKRMSKEAREKFDNMPVPKLKIKGFKLRLYPFQRQAMQYMMESWEQYGNVMRFGLNDEMGLGKTVQMIAFIVMLMQQNKNVKKKKRVKRVLVIVPNSITSVWAQMLQQYTHLDYQILSGTSTQRNEQLLERADITIINKECLRTKIVGVDEDENPIYEHRLPNLFTQKYDLAIIDEYHHFKNPTSQQTIGLHLMKDQIRQKVLLSGTPMMNGRPEELWSCLHFIWPKKFPDYNLFVRQHCVKRGARVVAYKNLKEVKDFLMKFENRRSLRRRKDQVMDDLPETVFVERLVELGPEQRRLYNDIRDRLLLWLEDHPEPKHLFNALQQTTRLKQAAVSPELYGGSPKSAKIDELKEIVKELVANGEKAIVFSQWESVVKIVEREMEQYSPAVVTGKVAAQKGSQARGTLRFPRQEQADRFNTDDECKLFIGTIGACKEGFTLSAGTYVIFVDEEWVPTNHMQAWSRSAAGGLRGIDAKVKHVHVIFLRGADTIDPDIADLLARKQVMNDRMTELDGGAAVERVSMSDIRSILTGEYRRSTDSGEAA